MLRNMGLNAFFYTILVQFYQSWTIFVTAGKHSLPAIHCLMTSKDQEFYQAIFARVCSYNPNLQPKTSISAQRLQRNLSVGKSVNT